jgi:hypothetical protein
MWTKIGYHENEAEYLGHSASETVRFLRSPPTVLSSPARLHDVNHIEQSNQDQPGNEGRKQLVNQSRPADHEERHRDDHEDSPGPARWCCLFHGRCSMILFATGYDRLVRRKTRARRPTATPPRPARPHLSSANTRGQMVRRRASGPPDLVDVLTPRSHRTAAPNTAPEKQAHFKIRSKPRAYTH